MEFVTIVILGLVGTAYLLGLDFAAVRLGLVGGNLVSAVGSLVIPEPVRSPLTRILFNLLMGVFFAAAYAYLFEVLKLADLRSYLSIGALMGFVHGAFVSFFFAVGLSAIQTGDEWKPFTVSSAVVNTLSHVVFGGIVGLGLGYVALEGTVMRYAGFLALAGVAGEGLLLLLVPQRLRPVRVHISRQP